MAAYPITIPGAYARADVMSPSSMASPLSVSSPYSVHSSLSNNSITGQTQASSFATSVNSTSTVASALSPHSEDESASLKKSKPHECDVCGACFARKVHLQRHSLRHQVCKPYCCERCGKCFSRQDSLVRHHRLLHEKIKEKPKRALSSGGATKKKGSNASRNSSRDFTKTSPLASSSFKDEEGRSQRRSSFGQMTIGSTYSSFDEEDEDMMSISEEASAFSPVLNYNGHGPRRATVSNMENLSHQSEFQCSFPRVFDDSFNPSTSQWASQLHHPHSFEMSHMDTSNFVDVKSLHPQQLHQHMASAPGTQIFYEASTPAASSEHEVPLLSLYQQASSPEQSMASTSSYDWSSMIHGSMTAGEHIMADNGQTPALPFSKSASDKSLNFTLSRGPEDNSCLPSPAIQISEQHQQYHQHHQNATTLAAPSSTSGTVNLASLGLPVPPNLNISLPADLQMSAENWDNLMRCLTLMANRPGAAAAASAAMASAATLSTGDQKQ